MRQVPPARERTRLTQLKSFRGERFVPSTFASKCARAGPASPLQVVNTTNNSIPLTSRNIFVNDDQSSVTQGAAHLREECTEFLRVMEDIAKQDCIDSVILNREGCAIKLAVVYLRFSCSWEIYSRNAASQQRTKVMRDESIATPHVQEMRAGRNEGRDLQSHVISPANLPSPALALPTARDAFLKVVKQLLQPTLVGQSMAFNS